MTNPVTPRLFHAALAMRGFRSLRNSAYKDSAEVRAICSAGISRKNTLASVSLGFWMFELSGLAPETYNRCHIYGSIGSIIPRFRGLQAVSGQSSSAAWQELINHTDDIADAIDSHLSINSLNIAFRHGFFKHCLILKEARMFLELGLR